MKDVLIKGLNICKSFRQGTRVNPVLNNIDLEIYTGDFTVIMGPSGAGKSTLLYALSGLDKITSGSIFFRDKEISLYSEKKMTELRAKEFGFIFQQTHLITNLSLFENVAVAGYLDKNKTEKEITENALRILNEMDVSAAGARLPYQTSGGESQRAAIARAVINEPGLLFADEPTGALNRSSSDKVFDILINLHKKSHSILLATHDVRAAVRGTRILYLEDGHIVAEMKMPSFDISLEKEREKHVNNWLSGLSW